MNHPHKRPPEPTLFVETADLYRRIRRGHFGEWLAQALDLWSVAPLAAPLYADKLGRPSLDPVVFFRCMLIGFFENIVSGTELEYRIADSLTLRRFLGYSLEGHTTMRAPYAGPTRRCPRRRSTRCSRRCLTSARRPGC